MSHPGDDPELHAGPGGEWQVSLLEQACAKQANVLQGGGEGPATRFMTPPDFPGVTLVTDGSQTKWLDPPELARGPWICCLNEGQPPGKIPLPPRPVASRR